MLGLLVPQLCSLSQLVSWYFSRSLLSSTDCSLNRYVTQYASMILLVSFAERLHAPRSSLWRFWNAVGKPEIA